MAERPSGSWRGRASLRTRGARGGTTRVASGLSHQLVAAPDESDPGGDSGMEADGEDGDAYIPPLASAPVPAPAPAPAPASAGVRVPLEVLGEDSESRKKRFESSLASNRFMELKPLREEQRRQAIQQGLLPDPLKPTRLDQATDFVGTCEEMCPEFEREEREYQNNVDVLERYPGSTRIDPARAVKAFHRPAAGNDQPLPSDVRPPAVLERSLDYLFHDVLPAHPLHVTHPFLRDRTRAVRQDFTMQNVRGASAIECNERIARYHVLALGTLREHSSFSESQELEQLRKVLKSLNEFYDDARAANPPIPTPNEPEFRSYNILTHLRDPDIIWSTELLPASVFNAPLFQTALTLHALAQRSHLARGERASPHAFSRFFKLLAQPDVPYLFGCILSTHFGEIRRSAIDTLRKVYVNQHSLMPARTLAKVLGCDDEEEVVEICETLGLNVGPSEHGGRLVVELHRGITLEHATLKPRVSKRIVEGKRGSTPYRDVIDGADYASKSVPAIPATPSLSSSFPRPPATTPTSFSSPTPSTPSYFGAQSLGKAPSPLPPPFGAASTPIVTPEVTPPPPSFFTPKATTSFSNLNPSASAFSPSSVLPSSSFSSTPDPPRLPTLPPPKDTSPAPAPAATRAPFSFSTTPVPVDPPPAALPSPVVPPPRLPSPQPQKSPVPPPLARKESLQVPSPAHGPERKRMLARLVENLTLPLLQQVVELPSRRACEEALKERWETVLRDRKRTRAQFVAVGAAALGASLFKQAAGMAAREAAFVAVREARVLRKTLGAWVDATGASILRAEVEAEKALQFDNIARTIGIGPVGVVADEDEDEDDLSELDLSSLSLSGLRLGAQAGDADKATAQMLETAQQTRDSIWAPGTFLQTIAGKVDSSLRNQAALPRLQWNIILAVEAESDPFATWLACKFDVQEPELQSSMDTTFADVEVHMVTGGTSPDSDALENTGLVAFDCTSAVSEPESEEKWRATRERLHVLIASILSQSIYPLALLVLACPSRQMDETSERSLAQKVLAELSIASLHQLRSSSVFVARLHDADSRLQNYVDLLLPSIVMRPEKTLVPLSNLVAPLLTAWETYLRRSMTFHAALAHRALPILVTSLNMVVQQALSCGIRPPVAELAAFPVPELAGTVPDTIRRYIGQQSPSISFTLLEEALTERPPVPDARLVRLLLEQLAQHVRMTIESGWTRREVISEGLPLALERVQSYLDLSMRKLAASIAPSAEAKVNGARKRKASFSPVTAPNGAHKKERSEAKDPLSDLSALIRDARSLLAPRTS